MASRAVPASHLHRPGRGGQGHGDFSLSGGRAHSGPSWPTGRRSPAAQSRALEQPRAYGFVNAALAGSARGRPRAVVFVNSCKSYLPAGGQTAQQTPRERLPGARRWPLPGDGTGVQPGPPWPFAHQHVETSSWLPCVRGEGSWGVGAASAQDPSACASSFLQATAIPGLRSQHVQTHLPPQGLRGPAWSQGPYPSGLFQGKDSLLGDSTQRVVPARATPHRPFFSPQEAQAL